MSARMDTVTTVDRERDANKKEHRSLLLKPGFSTTHAHVSPKTGREVVN